jgi:hypothetical protein
LFFAHPGSIEWACARGVFVRTQNPSRNVTLRAPGMLWPSIDHARLQFANTFRCNPHAIMHLPIPSLDLSRGLPCTLAALLALTLRFWPILF